MTSMLMLYCLITSIKGIVVVILETKPHQKGKAILKQELFLKIKSNNLIKIL